MKKVCSLAVKPPKSQILITNMPNRAIPRNISKEDNGEDSLLAIVAAGATAPVEVVRLIVGGFGVGFRVLWINIGIYSGNGFGPRLKNFNTEIQRFGATQRE